jgi:hypothetical protein
MVFSISHPSHTSPRYNVLTMRRTGPGKHPPSAALQARPACTACWRAGTADEQQSSALQCVISSRGLQHRGRIVGRSAEGVPHVHTDVCAQKCCNLIYHIFSLAKTASGVPHSTQKSLVGLFQVATHACELRGIHF